jgi:hypothetical protein
LIAESLGGWDGDGMAGGQQAGEECAESKERGGCEQAASALAFPLAADTQSTTDFSGTWKMDAARSESAHQADCTARGSGIFSGSKCFSRI